MWEMGRIPRTALLIAFLMLLLAIPASSWGCTAPVNSIFVNPCADTTYGSALVQFESDTVQGYLATHGLPSTDSYVVYTYGRSDLRTEIRGLMMLELFEIITQAPSDRSAQGTALYNWFLNRVWTNEKNMTQAAVNDKNSFLADKCDWTPDVDIASQYGFVYEGGAFCPGQLLSLFASPTVPAESYFQAAAFKKIYGNTVAGQPAGGQILDLTISNMFANAAYTAIPTVATSILVKAGVNVGVKLIAPFTRDASQLAKAGVRSVAKAALETVEDTAPEVEEGADVGLGPGIIVGVMIEVAVAAGTEAYDADQTLATLGDLDTLNTAAQQTPPDLSAFLNDESVGILKLHTSFVSATLPEVFLTTPLPTHRTTDPFFEISAVGGTPVPNTQMTYQDWNNTVWTASTWGGWFVQSNVKNGVTYPSITASLNALYPGTPNNDDLTVGRFSADRFIVAPDNSFNIDCPIDPATGESDTQGTTAVEFCNSFVERNVALFDGNGVLQFVALPHQDLPVFPDGPTRNMNFPVSSTNATVYYINATGTPTPSLIALTALPPGFTFVNSATLGIPGEAEVVGPLNVQLSTINSFTVQATNNGGSATQTVNLNYSSAPISYLSPNSVTFTRGLPATFNVSVLGVPPLTMSAFFKALPDGMTFVDHGGGSATLSGTPALDAVGCDPNGSPEAIGGSPCVFDTTDGNGHDVDQFFTITVVSPPTPQISGPASANYFVGNSTASVFSATGAQTQTHFTASIPAAISGWLSITDFGNGSAQVSGTAPTGSSGTYNVTVILTADGVAGSVQANFAVTIIGLPAFTTPSTFSVQVGSFLGASINTNVPATFTLSGQLPIGSGFTSNPNGVGILASLGLDPAPGSGGVYPLIVTATNSYGQAEQYLTVNVLEAPSFSTLSPLKLMVGVNRQIPILTNGFPRIPGFVLPSGAVSAGISILGGGNQLPSGTAIHPAAANGSNSGAVILTGTPFPGSPGSYNVTLVAQSEVGFSQQIFTLIVAAAGDVNGDGVASCSDVALVKASLNKKQNQVGYNLDADVNRDGVVDIKDQAFVTAQLPKGTKCP